jgi:hypothetical protein
MDNIKFSPNLVGSWVSELARGFTTLPLKVVVTISDKGSWRCSVNLSFMRTISRYNNNEIPLTSSSQGEVANTNAHSGGRSVYTNNISITLASKD